MAQRHLLGLRVVVITINMSLTHLLSPPLGQARKEQSVFLTAPQILALLKEKFFIPHLLSGRAVPIKPLQCFALLYPSKVNGTAILWSVPKCRF